MAVNLVDLLVQQTRWHDYTGTTLEEMQGWGWQKVHHPDHVDRGDEERRPLIE